MNLIEIPQTPFDAKTLNHFRELLVNRRKEAEEQLDIFENRISNLREADDADYSSVAHHMGDVGSDLEEEEMNYQMLERTKKYVRQINDALERIENGTYGICQATGRLISRGRLEVVPHTRFSIEAKKRGIVEDL